MMVDILLYCGVNEKMWNKHPVAPGEYACVAPCYGKSERTHNKNRVKLPPDTLVIQDSGAFSDSQVKRLCHKSALERQYAHSEEFNYNSQITHRASYDLLIDEKWENGVRSKRRWSENDAESAVRETVEAVMFMKRTHSGGTVLSAQGVTANQYLKCAMEIFPLMDMDKDIFGLGGWCITGKMSKRIMPSLRSTFRKVIPAAANAGVKRVHIWGVLYAPALRELLSWCKQFDIVCSTDSSGPQVRPCFGEWGYDDWRNNNYKRHPVETRGLERARHVQLTREWLSNFSERRTFNRPVQMSLFQE